MMNNLNLRIEDISRDNVQEIFDKKHRDRLERVLGEIIENRKRKSKIANSNKVRIPRKQKKKMKKDGTYQTSKAIKIVHSLPVSLDGYIHHLQVLASKGKRFDN